MKSAPKKSQLPKPAPIVIKIDPNELKNGIILPEIKYEVVATVEHHQVFHGMVLPIPKVLVYYLNNAELKVVSMIIEETNDQGFCALSVIELAAKLKMSTIKLSSCLQSLRKIGLLLEMPNGRRGNGKMRKLNYEAIQHLNDLVEGEDPGVYSRIRKASRKFDISHMTKEDILNAYDNKVLAPDHDPIEEEEYD